MTTNPPTTSVSALADRCEAATGPDREIDADILETLADDRWRALEMEVSMPCGAPPEIVRREARLLVGYRYPFTSSLDVAVTLVPKGWAFSLGEMMGLPIERRWRCHLRDHNEPYNPATCKWVDRDCRTPALAICAAALRAIALQENSNVE